MKRRLNRAYDHMTMPEGCTQRIEAALRRELENRQESADAAHTRVIAPVPGRRHVWLTAVAAVLAVMLISVGGVYLMLPPVAAPEPEQQLLPPQTTAPVPETTPEDFYAAATDLSAAEVEAAAMEIRQAVLREDWLTFYKYLVNGYWQEDFPMAYGDQFVNYMALYEVQEEFRSAMEEETCRRMFCNGDDGISIGAQGQIWLREVEGKLKIAAVNGMVSPQPSYEYERMEDGTICLLRYRGSRENVRVPATIDEIFVTRLGTGVFQGCEGVKTVTVTDNIRVIAENAFAECANLVRVDVGPGVGTVGSRAFAECPALRAVCFYGDAPAAGSGLFDGSKDVTVYYNEPTNGWGSNWMGRPTASRLGLGEPGLE